MDFAKKTHTLTQIECDAPINRIERLKKHEG